LDEPTSGLDSTTAHYIMKTLLNVAKKGRTVICTIHQPRSDIFHMFDQIMLLCKGRNCYFGPANNMVSYFTEIGYICPTYCNPADFACNLFFIFIL
jgi:ATP-binding cassette subfamily G (WHITE) protein 8 (sterolin 2)